MTSTLNSQKKSDASQAAFLDALNFALSYRIQEFSPRPHYSCRPGENTPTPYNFSITPVLRDKRKGQIVYPTPDMETTRRKVSYLERNTATGVLMAWVKDSESGINKTIEEFERLLRHEKKKRIKFFRDDFTIELCEESLPRLRALLNDPATAIERKQLPCINDTPPLSYGSELTFVYAPSFDSGFHFERFPVGVDGISFNREGDAFTVDITYQAGSHTVTLPLGFHVDDKEPLPYHASNVRVFASHESAVAYAKQSIQRISELLST